MALTSLLRPFRQATALHAAARVGLARNDAARASARRHLAAKLGKLRGLPQKMGQMLSFSATDDAAADFADLQNQAEPLPLAELLPSLEEAWGRPWLQVVREIDPIGKAASLGQVHRAILHDGRVVAIKIQFPGMQAALQADLKTMGWMTLPFGGRPKGFDWSDYRQVILADLEAELDYRREADSQTEMHRAAKGYPGIRVPEVIRELSSEKVLVTEWLSGDTWQHVREEWTADEHRQLAKSLLPFFLDGLLERGVMQADWHPGNVSFLRGPNGPQWILYDFGGLCRLSESQRGTLSRLIHATQDRSESPWNLFQQLGFDSAVLAPLRAKLPALCRILFEPFLVDRPYRIADWNLAERVSDILGDDRWNFRTAAPAELMFLMRAFHGVSYYLQNLQTAVRWPLPKKRCPSTADEQVETSSSDYAGLAQWMKVRVHREGRLVVQLTQPASAVERLPDLLDDDLLKRITQRGIDLAAICRSVRQRGFPPGEIFALCDSSREIHVCLE